MYMYTHMHTHIYMYICVCDMMIGFVLFQLNVVGLLDLQCKMDTVSISRWCDRSLYLHWVGYEVLDCVACFRYHLPVFRKD